MSNIPSRNITKQQVNTLENLIEGLDQRGCLVFQVLLGQQAMKLLSEKPIKQITKGTTVL